MLRLLVVMLAMLIPACASKLDRELTDKAPKGLNFETVLDLEQIVFRQVRDGAQVQLGEAMRTADLNHVLLVFGSRGCAICNREARALQDNVVGRHELFFTDAGRRFQVIGVNTDGVLDERLKAYLAPLPFIQWNDPAGAEMLAHFMPPGRRFAVPLVVLVQLKARGEAGIVWRVLPEEAGALSVDELMQRVSVSLRGEDPGSLAGGENSTEKPQSSDDTLPGRDQNKPGDVDGETDKTPGDGREPGEPVGSRARQLADMLPGRLEHVPLKTCGGAPTHLAALAKDFELVFVQAVKGVCDAECRQLGRHVRQLCEAGLPDGRRCAYVRLVEGEACLERDDYVGSDTMFEVFATHFNWAYRPVENPDYSLSLPSVQGPLWLAFEASGRLAWSHEGNLAATEFDEHVRRIDPKLPARGPDFRFYSAERAEFGFADLRRQARYTIVNAFSTICSSCIAELKHWSLPGNIVDFCAGRPDDCQIVAVERTDFVDPRQGLRAYYDSVVSTLAAESIRVPVLLDPTPVEDYLARFFDGYVSALKPEWGGLYGTLVYDQEGKIVKSFRPADASASRGDEALEYMRQSLP